MNKKIIYLLLAVCVVFLPVFNEPQTDNIHEHIHINCGHEHNHANNKNDHDKNCPVCIKIELSKNAGGNIRFLSTAVYSVIDILQYADTVFKNSESHIISISPVALKVRFNT